MMRYAVSVSPILFFSDLLIFPHPRFFSGPVRIPIPERLVEGMLLPVPPPRDLDPESAPGLLQRLRGEATKLSPRFVI